MRKSLFTDRSEHGSEQLRGKSGCYAQMEKKRQLYEVRRILKSQINNAIARLRKLSDDLADKKNA